MVKNEGEKSVHSTSISQGEEHRFLKEPEMLEELAGWWVMLVGNES